MIAIPRAWQKRWEEVGVVLVEGAGSLRDDLDRMPVRFRRSGNYRKPDGFRGRDGRRANRPGNTRKLDRSICSLEELFQVLGQVQAGVVPLATHASRAPSGRSARVPWGSCHRSAGVGEVLKSQSAP